MRADQLLVVQGLAPSRSAALRLIARGAVRWRAPGRAPEGWALPRKAGEDLPEGCEIEVIDAAELRFASRGGLKLDGALAHTGVDVRGAVCLDVGQGSGGFTDVLLQRGAARVVGVDVGHQQLHPRLRADARVTALEGINARHLRAAQLPVARFDLITGDLSFISLTQVLGALVPLLGGELLMLVKPQFELQPTDIHKGGLVRDASAYARVEQRICAACRGCGLKTADWFESCVTGGDGNREFFVRAARASEPQR
jgi:23S rRNA (cytidine1920-2'-O)/16S rRNA (cytidine1409-2'-O)-methyltransferase